jgi:hypothetical protein
MLCGMLSIHHWAWASVGLPGAIDPCGHGAGMAEFDPCFSSCSLEADEPRAVGRKLNPDSLSSCRTYLVSWPCRSRTKAGNPFHHAAAMAPISMEAKTQ